MATEFDLSEEEYLSLLELAFEAAQALQGRVSPDGRRPDTQNLALKLFAHAATAHWLYKGTKSTMPASTNGASFIDFGSIAVLARAALETYLTFFEVFVSPQDDDEFEFQYCLWHLAGQVALEGMEPQDPSLHDNYRGAMEDIASLRERLRTTRKFQGLTQRQQNQVLSGRRSRDWKSLASSAGFGLTFIRRIYGYYSGFAHSDGLTASQLMSATSKDDQLFHAKMHLVTIMMVLSKFILDYGRLFEETRSVFPRFPEAHQRAQVWSAVAAGLG